MHRIFLILATTALLFSCQKEDIKGPECNCGIIMNYMSGSVSGYTRLNIKNDCTGNYRTFDVKYSKASFPIGDKYCAGIEW